jgi:hypothetical protein
MHGRIKWLAGVPNIVRQQAPLHTGTLTISNPAGLERLGPAALPAFRQR